jgi:nicotinamide-nucleotide amidase
MKIELLTVGTELLLGFTIDTNGAEIARALASIGVEIVRRTSVGDDRGAIQDAAGSALDRTGTVLVTGGLGPTRDDVTRHAVAQMLDLPLEFHEEVWQQLVERFRSVGRQPAATNRSQAEVPRGGTVLRNRWGTAPGLWLESSRGVIIMLPGVPIEMRNLLAHEVLPRLAPRAGSLVVRSRTVRTTAIPESTLAERLGDIEAAVHPLALAYLPGLEGVDLRLTSWGADAAESDARLEAGAAEVRRRAGEHVYGEGDESLAGIVLNLLRTKGLTIGVAESCTGGLLGGRLTDVPGSSDVFRGGIIAYDNGVKVGQLGVPLELLGAHGAVSEPVAQAMAEGVRQRLAVDVGVGITGIAGPGGGTPDKPVGTVCLTVAGLGEVYSRRTIYLGSRPEIRARAVQTALFMVRQRILCHSGTS